jgi:hypothetical protein
MGERGLVRRFLVLTACGVTSIVGIPAGVASASAPAAVAAPNASCAKWDFVQKARKLSGTAQGPTFRGTISGTAKPGDLVFTITWTNHVVGHYNGEITNRSIVGKTYYKKDKATWSATGPTACRG